MDIPEESYLEFAITDFCNLKCRLCSQGTPFQRDRKTLSLQELDEFSRFFQPYEFDVVKISGGEPTLHPEFALICDRLREMFIARRYDLSTNGFRLEQFRDHLHAFDRIELSLYPGENDEVFHRLNSLAIPNMYACEKQDYLEMMDVHSESNLDKSHVFLHCPFSNVKKVVQDRIYQCCVVFGQSIRQGFDREEVSVPLNDRWRENLQEIDIEQHCRRCFIDVDAPQRRDLSSIGFVIDCVSEPDSGQSERLDLTKGDPAGIRYKEKEALNLPSPAQAYWRQRHALSECRDRILALCDAVNWPTDLHPYQWAQLMGYALEFAPDLILELGRGKGNSTCAFTQAANKLESGACRVVSLCQSDSWERESLPRVRQVVPAEWFDPLDTLTVISSHLTSSQYWRLHGESWSSGTRTGLTWPSVSWGSCYRESQTAPTWLSCTI